MKLIDPLRPSLEETVMKKIVSASLTLLMLITIVWPQRTATKGVPKPPARIEIDDDATPSTKDLTFYLNFGVDGNASIEIRGNDGTRSLTPIELASFLQRITTSSTKRPSMPKLTELRPVYVVKPDLSLSLSAIWDAINSVRNDSANNISIDLGDGAAMYVRKKVSALRSVKPNPLFLMIDVSADNSIMLNGEDQGKLSDLRKLESFLSKIFSARSENGVFRGSTNTVDTTVNIRVPRPTKFEDIKRLFSAVNSAGSDRIFLYVDDKEPIRSVMISGTETAPIKK